MSRKRPLVSVIVPVFNVESFVRRCVESVLSQDMPSFELILVDDGSRDKSGQICGSFLLDKRVRVVHKENGGLSSARNAGLDIAVGDYVFFLDADDYLPAQSLSLLLSAQQRTKADIVCGNYDYVDEQGKYLIRECYETVQPEEVISSSEALNRLSSGRFGRHITAWAHLYRRSLFHNLRFPLGVTREDEATTYKAYYGADTIALISHSVYHYTMRSGSIMHSGQKQTIDNEINLLQALQDRFVFFFQHDRRDFAINEFFHFIEVASSPVFRRASKEQKESLKLIKQSFSGQSEELLGHFVRKQAAYRSFVRGGTRNRLAHHIRRVLFLGSRFYYHLSMGVKEAALCLRPGRQAALVLNLDTANRGERRTILNRLNLKRGCSFISTYRLARHYERCLNRVSQSPFPLFFVLHETSGSIARDHIFLFFVSHLPGAKIELIHI